eukprot:582699-Rhodomonas_salina.1
MAGFQVLLSTTPDRNNAVECYAAVSGVAPPQEAEVLCDGTGRYLWIVSPGNFVQICEVEVFPPPSTVCLGNMQCPANSVCTRTADGHQCTCLPGFTGFVEDGSATGACVPLPNLARSCGESGSDDCPATQSSQFAAYDASRA